MRQRDLFSFGGSVFYIGAFALFCGSFYWLWRGLAAWLAPLGALAPYAAAVLPIALFIGIFYAAAPALTLLFGLAAWAVLALDISIFGYSAHLAAYVLLLFASTGAIIIAADYLPRLNMSLPEILLFLFALVFILPITALGKLLGLLGLVKKDDE